LTVTINKHVWPHNMAQLQARECSPCFEHIYLLHTSFIAWTLLVAWQKGHLACKKSYRTTNPQHFLFGTPLEWSAEKQTG